MGALDQHVGLERQLHVVVRWIHAGKLERIQLIFDGILYTIRHDLQVVIERHEFVAQTVVQLQLETQVELKLVFRKFALFVGQLRFAQFRRRIVERLVGLGRLRWLDVRRLVINAGVRNPRAVRLRF
jgi:hypothetical protein